MTDGMPRTRLPYLRHEKNRHKTLVWYFRKGDGPRIRLRAPYGSKAFQAEYDAALSGSPVEDATPSSGTVKWLVERYKESGKFLTSYKESTRTVRSRVLNSFCEKSGHLAFSKLTKAAIQKGLDEKAKTAPHMANNTLIYVSAMFDWAVNNDHLKANPCDGIKMFKLEKGEGFRAWTQQEVEKFRARHKLGTKARLALDILLYCGLRRSDIFRLGRQHVKNGLISMQTMKTNEWVYLPVFPELQKSIDATTTGDLTFLTSALGQPFASAQSFGNWFKARCVEADLPDDCAAHGVRKASATIAANEGATAKQLMAMYGWKRIGMAERYTEKADKIRLARQAAELISNAAAPHLEQSAAEIQENITKTISK